MKKPKDLTDEQLVTEAMEICAMDMHNSDSPFADDAVELRAELLRRLASIPASLDKSSCEFCDDKGVVLDKETGLVVDCPECDNPDIEREVFLSSVPMPMHLSAEQLRGIRSKIAEGEAGMYEAALLLQHLDSIPAEFYRVKWNEEQLQGLMEQTKRANAPLDVEKVAREIYIEASSNVKGWFTMTKADEIEIEKIDAILRKHLPSPEGKE